MGSFFVSGDQGKGADATEREKKGFGWTPVFAPEVRFLFLHFRIWENEGEEGVFASPRGENSWEKNHGFFLFFSSSRIRLHLPDVTCADED